MSDNTELSKRDIVVQEIEKGGATMDSLCKAADCKYASIMSIFSTLRLMGKCAVKDVPGKDKDGNAIMTYRFVDVNEWEKIKAKRSAEASTRTSSARTPEQVLAAAEKKLERCKKAAALAKERNEKAPKDEMLQLKKQKTDIELKLAQMELAEAKSNMPKDAAPTAEKPKTAPTSEKPAETKKPA